MIPNLTIRTKEERDALLALLSDMSQEVFSSNDPSLLNATTEYEKYPWFKDIKLFVDSFKKRDLEPRACAQEIKELSDYLSDLEVAKMSLSFYPSDAFSKEIYDILSALSKDKVLIEFVLDESVSLGAKLLYKGKYIDLGLQPRIVNLLKSEDVINKYL